MEVGDGLARAVAAAASARCTLLCDEGSVFSLRLHFSPLLPLPVGTGSCLSLGPGGQSQMTISPCDWTPLGKAIQKVAGVAGLVWVSDPSGRVFPLLPDSPEPFCPFLHVTLVVWDTV